MTRRSIITAGIGMFASACSLLPKSKLSNAAAQACQNVALLPIWVPLTTDAQANGFGKFDP